MVERNLIAIPALLHCSLATKLFPVATGIACRLYILMDKLSRRLIWISRKGNSKSLHLLAMDEKREQ